MLISYLFKFNLRDERSMSADTENRYDDLIVYLNKILPKVDPELALKVLYYERKMTDVYPSVEMEISYVNGTDRERKRAELFSKYGFQIALHGKNNIFAKGNMNMDIIKNISDDKEVEEITGIASVASY